MIEYRKYRSEKNGGRTCETSSSDPKIGFAEAWGRSPGSRIILLPGLPTLDEGRGVVRDSFPITVAGTASAFHGLPSAQTRRKAYCRCFGSGCQMAPGSMSNCVVNQITSPNDHVKNNHTIRYRAISPGHTPIRTDDPRKGEEAFSRGRRRGGPPVGFGRAASGKEWIRRLRGGGGKGGTLSFSFHKYIRVQGRNSCNLSEIVDSKNVRMREKYNWWSHRAENWSFWAGFVKSAKFFNGSAGGYRPKNRQKF
jgi:hypothetical protein